MAAPTAVHAEKRVLALNPDVTAAGNTRICCQRESRKFNFATYQMRDTRAPGSGKHTPLPINASYKSSLGITALSHEGIKNIKLYKSCASIALESAATL